LEIQPKRNVLNVSEIEIGVIAQERTVFTVPDGRLPKTSEARLHNVPHVLPRFVMSNDGGQFRPWTDEAHFASNHIPQLREFVQASSAEPPAQGCMARIVRGLVPLPAILKS